MVSMAVLIRTSVPGYLREEEEHKPDPSRNPIEINHMGLHLENEVAVVKTATIISNNPVFCRKENLPLPGFELWVVESVAQSLYRLRYPGSKQYRGRFSTNCFYMWNCTRYAFIRLLFITLTTQKKQR